MRELKQGMLVYVLGDYADYEWHPVGAWGHITSIEEKWNGRWYMVDMLGAYAYTTAEWLRTREEMEAQGL